MATSATPADALIHARGLTKRFAKLMAVDAIDFDVERGEAFRFLGPNGAGKTSTMRLIGCVYLIVLGVAGLALAATRLERLLLK